MSLISYRLATDQARLDITTITKIHYFFSHISNTELEAGRAFLNTFTENTKRNNSWGKM